MLLCNWKRITPFWWESTSSKPNWLNIFIEAKNYKPIDNKSFFNDELIGFSVYKGSEKIGVIEGINSELPQPVFEVIVNSKKIMIPIHEDLIEKINRKKNIIHIDIPDGLIEII